MLVILRLSAEFPGKLTGLERERKDIKADTKHRQRFQTQQYTDGTEIETGQAPTPTDSCISHYLELYEGLPWSHQQGTPLSEHQSHTAEKCHRANKCSCSQTTLRILYSNCLHHSSWRACSNVCHCYFPELRSLLLLTLWTTVQCFGIWKAFKYIELYQRFLTSNSLNIWDCI